jgi:hypothetical protein
VILTADDLQGGGVQVKIGDRVEVETERASQTARHGVIEEVLQEQPPRFRVQWDDGHESILAPAAGAVRVEKQRTKTQRTKTQRTKARSR